VGELQAAPGIQAGCLRCSAMVEQIEHVSLTGYRCFMMNNPAPYVPDELHVGMIPIVEHAH
jgi:hypothetical protein